MSTYVATQAQLKRIKTVPSSQNRLDIVAALRLNCVTNSLKRLRLKVRHGCQCHLGKFAIPVVRTQKKTPEPKTLGMRCRGTDNPGLGLANLQVLHTTRSPRNLPYRAKSRDHKPSDLERQNRYHPSWSARQSKCIQSGETLMSESSLFVRPPVASPAGAPLLMF